MAVIQGVGYPAPNLSHFRSIEIWDTASDSDRYLSSGWLTRASRGNAAFAACSADGAIIGAADPGPLGGGARTVALQDPDRFARQARLARVEDHAARGALAHVMCCILNFRAAVLAPQPMPRPWLLPPARCR